MDIKQDVPLGKFSHFTPISYFLRSVQQSNQITNRVENILVENTESGQLQWMPIDTIWEIFNSIEIFLKGKYLKHEKARVKQKMVFNPRLISSDSTSISLRISIAELCSFNKKHLITNPFVLYFVKYEINHLKMLV